MSSCNSLIRTYLSTLHCKLDLNPKPFFPPLSLRPLTSVPLCSSISSSRTHTRSYSAVQEVAPLEDESPEELAKDTVEHLLTHQDDVARLMKMERKLGMNTQSNRWFPYFDRFRCGSESLSSREVIEAIAPALMEERKERLKRVVRNRSYSVCLVVEGLSDFGNVSATFRSADALGLQSVHVVACDSSKRYRENRHVSMGAEKWLDIELWNTPKECFEVLKSRGYQIATTHLGMDAVSIYDMDWSRPTAIVVGNENRGISDEALELSDLHCSIPMKGMVDSFNVSVAAGIVMHQAVCDRTMRLLLFRVSDGFILMAIEPCLHYINLPPFPSVQVHDLESEVAIVLMERVYPSPLHNPPPFPSFYVHDLESEVAIVLTGCHGDLSEDESQILLAEFLLRHNHSSISIAHEYAKRKARLPPITRL